MVMMFKIMILILNMHIILIIYIDLLKKFVESLEDLMVLFILKS